MDSIKGVLPRLSIALMLSLYSSMGLEGKKFFTFSHYFLDFDDIVVEDGFYQFFHIWLELEMRKTPNELTPAWILSALILETPLTFPSKT